MSQEFKIIEGDFQRGKAVCAQCVNYHPGRPVKISEDSVFKIRPICTGVIRRLELERYVSKNDKTIHTKGANYYVDSGMTQDPATSLWIVSDHKTAEVTEEPHPYCDEVNPNGNCLFYVPNIDYGLHL